MKRHLLVLTGLLILATYGFTQEIRCQEQMAHEKNPVMKLHMVDLTEEQRAEIDDSKYELEKKMIQLRADIQLKHLDFQKEMKIDDPSRSKLMELTEKISSLELKIKQLRIDHKLKIHSILTPEQRKQLKYQSQEIMIKKRIIKKNCQD